VRVIFAHHVADDARGFDVFLVGQMPVLVHREQDAAMHRLEAIAHVGQRARHDHAHGVIEIRSLHFIRDRDGTNVRGTVVAGRGIFGVSQ
jgi:hypothetical protein